MIMMTNRGYSGPAEVNYLFIDGGCLRNILSDYSNLYFGGVPIDLNYAAFTSMFSKVFYYDAIPIKKENETDSVYTNRTKGIELLIEHLEDKDRFHIYLGKSHIRRKRIEQKQVDMMIAIDMLKHTYNRNMHRATLLTTDSDFIPLLDTLVENGMDVTLWYAKTSNCIASKDLIKAADRRNRINIDQILKGSTIEFQEKFGLPERFRTHAQTALTESERWMDQARGTLELGIENKQFVLSYKNETNESPFAQVIHRDLDFLKTYVAEELNIVIPDKIFSKVKSSGLMRSIRK